MEKVRFACPRCQTIMQTGAEKVGYDVACPHCTHRFRLVESGDPASASRDDPSSSSDAATLPPTSFPQATKPIGFGDSGGMGLGSSGPIGTPRNPYQHSPGAINSPAMSHVVSQFPSSVPQSGFCCPYCQTTRAPRWKSEVSQIGWIVFAILLVTTCVCCFVGLFIRDQYRVCSQCNIRLG